ncbi:MAG: hypothetical protein RLZZ182_710 [Pseudomonadota bacterium]|jgi:uncharacterized membrane protein
MPVQPIDAPAADHAVLGSHPPERLARIIALRNLCLGCVLGLMALGLAWELVLAPLKGGTGALAWKVLPLAFAVTGLLKHRMYTFRWLSMLILLYFTEGVVRGTTDTGLSQQLAWVETALSLAVFVACSVYVRLRLRVKKEAQAASPAP